MNNFGHFNGETSSPYTPWLKLLEEFMATSFDTEYAV